MKTVENARPLAAKYLVKWRPEFMESATADKKPDSTPSDSAGAADVAVAS